MHRTRDADFVKGPSHGGELWWPLRHFGKGAFICTRHPFVSQETSSQVGEQVCSRISRKSPLSPEEDIDIV